MTTSDQTRPTRALVLGGGGVTGIAWEIGVLSGLLSASVDLRNADVVIGTSAGAYIGAAYAGGYDIEQLFAEQLETHDAEVATAASEATVTEWLEASRVGGADRAIVGAEFGNIAKAIRNQYLWSGVARWWKRDSSSASGLRRCGLQPSTPRPESSTSSTASQEWHSSTRCRPAVRSPGFGRLSTSTTGRGSTEGWCPPQTRGWPTGTTESWS